MSSVRELYGPELGALVLDRYMPDWYLKVDLEVLNMFDPWCCVAGQVFDGRGGYAWFISRMPNKPLGTDQNQRLGLTISEKFSNFFLLDDAWRELIAERRNRNNV